MINLWLFLSHFLNLWYSSVFRMHFTSSTFNMHWCFTCILRCGFAVYGALLLWVKKLFRFCCKGRFKLFVSGIIFTVHSVISIWTATKTSQFFFNKFYLWFIIIVFIFLLSYFKSHIIFFYFELFYWVIFIFFLFFTLFIFRHIITFIKKTWNFYFVLLIFL